MEYIILLFIGLIAGLVGGLLGIGGGIVMIPAMVLAFGENQHLYQAASMICVFFIAGASLIAHKKANALVPNVIKWLIPAGVAGIIIGVSISNSFLFSGEKSYLLARVFGVFLIYVAFANCLEFRIDVKSATSEQTTPCNKSGIPPKSMLTGLVTGISAGLLGIGAGSVSTLMQQLLMKMPLKKAMSNSAAAITCTALAGAFYKNLTLPKQGIEIVESLQIAAVIIPTAIIGGFAGGNLLHKLPKNIVRIAFIVIILIIAAKLLTVKPSL